MQTASRVADARNQLTLDEAMDVLVGAAHPRRISAPLLENRRQARADRVAVALDDWTSLQTLISKYGSGTDGAYELAVLATGELRILWQTSLDVDLLATDDLVLTLGDRVRVEVSSETVVLVPDA